MPGGDDHEVKASPTDTGHGSLQTKLVDSEGSALATATVGGVLVVKLPAIPAADDHKVKRDADAEPVYGNELLRSPNESISLVSDPESPTIDVQVKCGQALPTVDGGAGTPGDPNDLPSSQFHQHPTTPTTGLTNVYYPRADTSDVADTRGDSNSNRLLSPIRDPPATTDGANVGVGFLDNGCAIFDFHTAPNDPSLALWPSGALMAKIWAKVDGGLPGCTYKLYAGGTVPVPPLVYYLQADGSLAAFIPGTDGELTAVVSNTAAITMLSPAIGQTTWPGGTVPVKFWAWVTGGPGGSYTFGLVGAEAIGLDRGFVGGGGACYQYSDHRNIPPVRTITSTPQLFTFNVPVLATTGALSTDWMVLVLNAWGANGATLHLGYGPTMPSGVETLFPPPARPSLVPLTRESSTGTTVVDYTQAPPPPLPGYVGTLTDTYQLFEFPLLAAACAGNATDRLRYSLAAFCDHALGDGAVLYVQCGGPNASELDSLFGMPGQGGISGRIHTPDVAVTITGGTITMGNSNSATASGTGDVTGVATGGWDGGDVIWIRFHDACILKNGGSPGTGFAPFTLVSGGLGAGGQDIGVTAGSIIGFKLRADSSAWDEVASPAIE
jgi:hypothetical protein